MMSCLSVGLFLSKMPPKGVYPSSGEAVFPSDCCSLLQAQSSQAISLRPDSLSVVTFIIILVGPFASLGAIGRLDGA